MMNLDGRIAFLGGGKMAEAIINGLLTQGLAKPDQLVGSEPVAPRRAYLQEKYGIQTETSNLEAVADAPIVLFSVQPQVLPAVLAELRGRLSPDTLAISIVAGARISSLRNGLDHARIVRSMPNTPAQVGKGMTVWTATPDVSEFDRTRAQAILGALGDALYVADEGYLDMATALSGSGPGFVFLFIEAMIDAGVHIGFSRVDAHRLAVQTIEGSVALLREAGVHPAELRNRVTSPGGTTAAGIYELERGGLRAAITAAITAAYRRSKELGDLSEMNSRR